MTLPDALRTLAAHRAWRQLLADSHSSKTINRTRGELAPGTRRVQVPGYQKDSPVVQCGACGVLGTAASSLRLHRTLDGRCLDPATAVNSLGNQLMAPYQRLRDGRIVWCWPSSARPPRTRR